MRAIDWLHGAEPSDVVARREGRRDRLLSLRGLTSAGCRDLRTQVLFEERVHPVPRVANDEAPIEVVEFTGVRHEAYEIAFPRLQQMIDQEHRVNERHVDIRRPVQNQQRMLNLIDV